MPGGSQAGADKNRRVEIYLISGGVEFPQRQELEEGAVRCAVIVGKVAVVAVAVAVAVAVVS